MKFLDIHTHILPGVDDGARNVEESLEMLRNAEASHVAAVVATPHCNIPPNWRNYNSADFRGHFLALREKAKQAGIPVQIIAGAEVRVTEDLPRLLADGQILTINGGRYMLTEFMSWAGQEYCCDHLSAILSQGIIPLVAHPERYRVVQKNPAVVGTWLEMGCHIQLTSGSVLGKFGSEARKASDYLLRNDMVACVASDAHSSTWRTNYLMDVYDHLSLNYSTGYAQAVLWETPLRICSGEQL